MSEPRDEELSRIYRDAQALGPPQRVDDNIVAASRRVAGARPRSAPVGFARRWGAPVAIAATVVATTTLTLMVIERQSDLDTTATEAPPARRPAKISPVEPQRADASAKSSPAELPSAAPTAAPVPQAAARRDRQKTRPDESAPSGQRLGTGQPGFAAGVPRAPETSRKEETRPVPAAAAPFPGARAGADPQAPPPDAQRAPEVPRPALRAPVAGLAGDANTLRESALTLQRAGAVGAPAGRAAVSEGRERTPEKWLDDIRKLKTQGKTAEVDRELAEFKKRYPDYRLPEDLR
jgi:hypothetical protein